MWVSASPSGSSCGVAEHAPRGVIIAVAVGAEAAAGDTADPGPMIGLSGITDATPGLAVIAPTADAGTRAASAFTSR